MEKGNKYVLVHNLWGWTEVQKTHSNFGQSGPSINKAGNILYIQGYFYICFLRNRGVFQPSIKTYHNGQFELYIPQPQVLGTLRSPWLLTTSNGMILQVDTGFYTSHVVIAGFQPWTVYVLLNQDQHQ